jgi:hypothetical protein
MKPDKIHVEKPSDEDAKKKAEKKEALIDKNTVTIKNNEAPNEVGNVKDTPWGKDVKGKEGTGEEITDGEDG